jgi:hypothetical protein
MTRARRPVNRSMVAMLRFNRSKATMLQLGGGAR